MQKLEEMERTECLSHYGPDPYGSNQKCCHRGKEPVRLYWSYYCPDAGEGYIRFGCAAWSPMKMQYICETNISRTVVQRVLFVPFPDSAYNLCEHHSLQKSPPTDRRKSQPIRHYFLQ